MLSTGSGWIWHAWLERSMLTWLMDAVLNPDPEPTLRILEASDVLSYIATTAESVYCSDAKKSSYRGVSL